MLSPSHPITNTRAGTRNRRPALAVLLVIGMVTLVAAPAQASMNQLRIFERDGQTIIVSQDVGNQAFPYQWVENDPRRHPADGCHIP